MNNRLKQTVTTLRWAVILKAQGNNRKNAIGWTLGNIL